MISSPLPVLMWVARQFVFQASVAGMGDPHQTLFHQEIEGAVNSWFGQGRSDARKDFGTGQVLAAGVQNFQDGAALAGQAESFSTDLFGEVSRVTGHILL